MFKIALISVLALFTASSSFAGTFYNCADAQGTKLNISNIQGRAPTPYVSASLVFPNGEVVYLSETKNEAPADYTFSDAQGQIATVEFSTSQWTTPCGRCGEPTKHTATKAKLVYLNQTTFLNCN